MTPLQANSDMSHPIPACAGIGLRTEHHQVIQNTLPDIAWLEIHSENYFSDGGWHMYQLEHIRSHYPLSLHGVGLSLGSTDPLDLKHLRKLKKLIHLCEPGMVSDHLSWSSIGGHYFNDLLPLPYTEEALIYIATRIEQTQDFLGRQVLIENPSSYLDFTVSTIQESEFISEAARKTGCGILLDVNNIYVSAKNHGFEPREYINSIPVDLVREIHLAGFIQNHFEGGSILIDTHNQTVVDDVWELYQIALQRFGQQPTLIEWDTDLPALSTLLGEARKAQRMLESYHEHIS